MACLGEHYMALLKNSGIATTSVEIPAANRLAAYYLLWSL